MVLVLVPFVRIIFLNTCFLIQISLRSDSKSGIRISLRIRITSLLEASFHRGWLLIYLLVLIILLCKALSHLLPTPDHIEVLISLVQIFGSSFLKVGLIGLSPFQVVFLGRQGGWSFDGLSRREFLVPLGEDVGASFKYLAIILLLGDRLVQLWVDFPEWSRSSLDSWLRKLVGLVIGKGSCYVIFGSSCDRWQTSLWWGTLFGVVSHSSMELGFCGILVLFCMYLWLKSVVRCDRDCWLVKLWKPLGSLLFHLVGSWLISSGCWGSLRRWVVDLGVYILLVGNRLCVMDHCIFIFLRGVSVDWSSKVVSIV